MTGACGGIARRAPEVLLAALLMALPTDAFAQFTNQITQVSPESAPPGTNGLTVTFTLETDFPPPPPPGDGPGSAMIGGIGGTSITHTTSSSVTAVFDIPADEPPGSKDVTITFEVPGGTLTFSKTGGFTVGSSGGEEYNIERTLADGAQRNTIAFDGLAFLTGCLGAQSFLPPGKVADFMGFQYLRDNDPTGMGHNTDFVTIIAFNVLHILTQDQIGLLVSGAQTAVELVNAYAYERFPLMEAFRRGLDGDFPPGSSGLDRTAVMQYSAALYRIDGRISYDRARLLGGIVRSMSPRQLAALDSLKALQGVGNWNRNLTDPLASLHLEPDVNVAVMTFASEMYGWYAGSVEADTYFCPERQGTYFGSFYLKDWPCMGNPDCSIDEQLTAQAGELFLAALTDTQAAAITGLVDLQRSDLYEIADRREDISVQLRRFMTEEAVDSSLVLALSERYGELDGEIVCWYATRFAGVGRSLDPGQRASLEALADSLRYVAPAGAFLYSRPIPMPEIRDTDFLFGIPTSDAGGPDGRGRPARPAPRARPNPSVRGTVIEFTLPRAADVQLATYDVRGRLVSRVAWGSLAAGAHRLPWPGTDAAGRLLPAGTYLVKLETAVESQSVKITIAR